METEETTIIDRCVITGKMYSLTVKTADLLRFERGEDLIQNIFPYLSPGDREFIKSRITPEGWDVMFGGEE